MLLERFYNDLLAQSSYLIACQDSHTAIVVDPNRDIDRYIEAAAHHKLTIAYVTETHIHADFVSGARDLARKTGAKLLVSGEGGEDWSYRFAKSDGARLLRHGNVIELGDVRISVRHTPGHTPEHIAFLVTDLAASDRPLGMVTGDFVFVGDVGRPDLLERAANVSGTMDAMARQLFHSIRALEDLPDHLQLWPGHGAGSACGKSLGALPSTTLGYERIANWAFQIDDEEKFVREVLADQPEPPKYFAMMKAVNRDGPAPAPEHNALPEIGLADFERLASQGVAMIDVRSTADFASGHIPKTINIPTGSSFATWAGSLIRYDQDMVLLADDPKRIAKARHGLALIGLDRVIGRAGAQLRDAWKQTRGSLGTVRVMPVQELAEAKDRRVIDVRGASEWKEGHMANAEHRFLGNLLSNIADLPRDTPIAVHCQGGTRSAIAASLLQKEGFTDVANVAGGIQAWKAAGLPTHKD
ncbi:MAG TPA: rhodanese-like domain-containing protein [Gemmatimonadaceae bacterium]